MRNLLIASCVLALASAAAFACSSGSSGNGSSSSSSGGSSSGTSSSSGSSSGTSSSSSGSSSGSSSSSSSSGSMDSGGDGPSTACSMMDAGGNALGVGQFCNTATDCTVGAMADGGATLCATVGDPNAHFCTKTCTMPSDCGDMAMCLMISQFQVCVPNYCLGGADGGGD